MCLLLRSRWLRRCVTIPAIHLAFTGLLSLLPVWVIVSAAGSQFTSGRWRPLRLLWMLFTYLFLQTVMVVSLAGLWVADGFGRHTAGGPSVDRHYRLAGWYLRRLLGSARRTFNLSVVTEDDPEHPADPTRPILVFSRHAGAGDSVLLVDGLLNDDPRRRPRVILKAALQFDPVIDIIVNRVGGVFVGAPDAGRDDVVRAIGRLARTMTERDALVLFPEGGNFTERRRGRAIRRLRAAGRDDLAARATALRNVLPPKTLGVSTAIDAAPDATVVFVGHVGLERLATPADIWRYMPMDNTIRVRFWRVPPDEIPPAGEREHWLYEQWHRIDEWIDQYLPGAAGEPVSPPSSAG